jgi:hypothetical protein
MAGKGRPEKYKSHVEPHLEEITKMCEYMTEKQIAETLDVSYSCFREYKKKYPALNSAIQKGRQTLVFQLRSKLIQKAKGFHYAEKKTIKKYDPEFDQLMVIQEEEYERYSAPDVAALNLALKNYDPDNWANDPQMLKLKKEELKIKKELAEKDDY